MADSKTEFRIISNIADRAVRMAAESGVQYDKLTALMDVDSAHKSCPLRLGALLDADDANFAHDVLGIRRHMDRTTGELTDCFVPRYAKPA
ncbi:hypothetical protein LCGC14_2408200 [marine sediment metagenome]|uniref:DUF6874 domain-containing protein n=1 Tax=marine sediment metagenome TaxID=412755 RepID=A0A0F9BTC3_9ZZZZ